MKIDTQKTSLWTGILGGILSSIIMLAAYLEVMSNGSSLEMGHPGLLAGIYVLNYVGFCFGYGGIFVVPVFWFIAGGSLFYIAAKTLLNLKDAPTLRCGILGGLLLSAIMFAGYLGVIDGIGFELKHPVLFQFFSAANLWLCPTPSASEGVFTVPAFWFLFGAGLSYAAARRFKHRKDASNQSSPPSAPSGSQ